MASGTGMPASDAERQQVVDALAAHAAAGRLTLEELEERAEWALKATSVGDLKRATQDLPAAVEPPASTHRPRPTRWLLSVTGTSDRRGRWRVGRQLTALALLGGCDLDLRGAELDPAGARITVVAVLGGVDLYVPDSVQVELAYSAPARGAAVRGSPRRPRRGAPRLCVRAFCVMGRCQVWRLPGETAGMSLKQARQTATALERLRHSDGATST